MTLGWEQIVGLARLTFRDPKEGMEAVLSLPLPRQAIPMLFGVAVLLNSLLASTTYLMVPEEQAALALPMPMVAALFQFGLWAILIIALYWTGKWLDGQGSLSETMLTVSWMQLVMLPISAVAVAIGTVSLGLGFLVIMAARLFELWLFLNFVQVLHRLPTLWQAAKMILLAVVMVALGLGLMSSLIGVGAGVGV